MESKMNNQNFRQQWPAPGNVVYINTHVFFRHKGIVSDRWHNGKPMVISNSARRGGTYEESWDDFAQGRTVYKEGNPSQLPAWHVLANARACIQRKPYDLLGWNCESMVTYAFGLRPASPQLATVAVLGICAAFIFTATRK